MRGKEGSMFALFRYFTKKDVVLSLLLIVFLAGQTYCDVTLPTYTAEIVAKMQAGESAFSIGRTGLVMLSFAGMSAGAIIAETFFAGAISTGLAMRLREKIFHKVFTLSARETGKFSTASLLTRTTNDVQQVSGVLILFLRLGLGAPLMAVLAIIRIAQSGWELTLVTAAGVVVLLASQIAVTLVVIPKFRIVQRLTDRLNGLTRETLTGIRVVRAFRAEKYEEQRFDVVNREIKKTNIFTGRVTAVLFPAISLVSNFVTLAIYWVGCLVIVRRNDAAFFPTMFAFTQLAAQVILAFMLILMLVVIFPRAQVSARRIHEVLNAEPSVADPEKSVPLSELGMVEMKHVSFFFFCEEVLSDISFRVERGQTLAIIGATGAGKTTVLSLLERLYDPAQGEVKIGGADVRTVSSDLLHRTLAYVPQKSVLFSGTVRENIAFSRECDVEQAAQIACASEFIEGLEQGYDAPVLQGGRNFSGGQRQRLAIARAVAAGAPIMLFDDCFSALDFATDARVRSNLKAALPDVTKIIVAQRIGTVRDADAILVLKEGHAAGLGKHEELLQNCEEYRAIALSQLSREELGI